MTLDSLIHRMRGREADLTRSVVHVHRPGNDYFDEYTGITSVTKITVDEGTATIRWRIPDEETVGDEQQHRAEVLVKLPATAPVDIGDSVDVKSSPYSDRIPDGTGLIISQIELHDRSVTRRCWCSRKDNKRPNP